MARQDPVGNFGFRVEIPGFPSISFSEVEIGAVTVDVIEYREGGDNRTVRKLPGLVHYGNVTLRRGVLCSDQGGALDLYAWISEVVAGDIASARRNLEIVVLRDDRADCTRFRVLNAWPVKYAVGELEGRGREVFIESLELVNEGIERV
jgi:phage tail-like protein